MAPEVRDRKSKERGKIERLNRLIKGICTRCRKNPPIEGGRMCMGCREKGAKYVRKSEAIRRGYSDRD
jgi:hypothetical protein